MGKISLLQGLLTHPRHMYLIFIYYFSRLSSRGSVVQNPPANAGDADLIPGSERPLEEETAMHSTILVWKIPWTEEPSGLQSMGLQKELNVSTNTTFQGHLLS